MQEQLKEEGNPQLSSSSYDYLEIYTLSETILSD